jgi:hypothetical protein
MYPLDVAGHFGEAVDPFLIYRQPGTYVGFGTELRPKKIYEFVGGVHSGPFIG